MIDTNIVLDLLVFDDPGARELKAALVQGTLRWIATPPMRDELARVLAYPQIAPRLASQGLPAAEVLSAFDRQALRVDAAARAAVSCSDTDDQKFIDLAVQHRCMLLTKDAAVLALKKRLAPLGVMVLPSFSEPSSSPA